MLWYNTIEPVCAQAMGSAIFNCVDIKYINGGRFLSQEEIEGV